MSRLAFLLEVLISKTLPGSFELVTDCIDALNRIMSTSVDSTGSDVVYVEQLLMSCIELCSSQIKELPNITPSTIRFDVLVELMRSKSINFLYGVALLN